MRENQVNGRETQPAGKEKQTPLPQKQPARDANTAPRPQKTTSPAAKHRQPGAAAEGSVSNARWPIVAVDSLSLGPGLHIIWHKGG